MARCQRSGQTGVAFLKTYRQEVSTQKGEAITEVLCGNEFSAATVSRKSEAVDAEPDNFKKRRLEEACPHVILDARYETVPLPGVIRSQEPLVATGVKQQRAMDGRTAKRGLATMERVAVAFEDCGTGYNDH